MELLTTHGLESMTLRKNAHLNCLILQGGAFYLVCQVNKRYFDLSMCILGVILFPGPSFDYKATKHFL